MRSIHDGWDWSQHKPEMDESTHYKAMARVIRENSLPDGMIWADVFLKGGTGHFMWIEGPATTVKVIGGKTLKLKESLGYSLREGTGTGRVYLYVEE